MLHKIFIKASYIIIAFLILLSSCSTVMIDKRLKYNENMVLEEISSVDSSFNTLDSLLYVDISRQSMYLLKKRLLLSLILFKDF